MSTQSFFSSPSALADETACFSVQAESDPGVLPRLLEVIAKRGLTPSRVHATTLSTGANSPRLTIDLQVGGVDKDLQDVMAATRGQIHEVDRVLTARKAGL